MPVSVVDFFRDEIGLTISMSTLRKANMGREGPPPAMRWAAGTGTTRIWRYFILQRRVDPVDFGEAILP
jgi:hypothetical protein